MSNLLTQQDVADRFDVSVQTVRRWRERDGLPYLQLTARTIRIRETDLEKWLQSRERVAN